MRTIFDRPTVRERVAAEMSEGDQHGIELAGALGSAQMPRSDEGAILTLHDGAELSLRDRTQVVERDGRDLGLELAALLLRAKYAGDHSGIRRANFRFAIRLRVRTKHYLRGRGRKDQVIIAVASQSIAEWIADRCEPCMGTGLRNATMGGFEALMRPCTLCRDSSGQPSGLVVYKTRGVRPDGTPATLGAIFRTELKMQCPRCRGMRYLFERKRVHHNMGRICSACGGDGDAQPRIAHRARVINTSVDSYRRNWHQWFDWAAGHLKALDKTLISHLRCELGQGYSPAP